MDAVHERGALAVVAADLLALTLLEAPGKLGADVVVGSSQRFGVPMFYGGPHAGFMSVAAGLERHLPGRLVGVSVDAEGRPVPTTFTLTPPADPGITVTLDTTQLWRRSSAALAKCSSSARSVLVFRKVSTCGGLLRAMLPASMNAAFMLQV